MRLAIDRARREIDLADDLASVEIEQELVRGELDGLAIGLPQRREPPGVDAVHEESGTDAIEPEALGSLPVLPDEQEDVAACNVVAAHRHEDGDGVDALSHAAGCELGETGNVQSFDHDTTRTADDDERSRRALADDSNGNDRCSPFALGDDATERLRRHVEISRQRGDASLAMGPSKGDESPPERGGVTAPVLPSRQRDDRAADRDDVGVRHGPGLPNVGGGGSGPTRRGCTSLS
jgi:hypothetical protein